MNAIEKINTLLLCDIAEHLEIQTDVDVKLVRAAIEDGHTWALEQQYAPDRSTTDEARKPVVAKVHDIMRLWTVIEDAYEELTAEEKAELAKRVPHFGKDPKFYGFDGNHEYEHMSTLKFMVEHLGYYSNFKGRESLNSHSPTLEAFERMWAAYQPISEASYDHSLSLEDLVTILSERAHPSMR